MARFEKSRTYILRGIVVFFLLILIIGIYSSIAKGGDDPFEEWDLYGDFEKEAYIFRSCYIIENLEELRMLSFMTGKTFHWFSIRNEFFVACPVGIYMLINFKKGGELDNCFCLEKYS